MKQMDDMEFTIKNRIKQAKRPEQPTVRKHIAPPFPQSIDLSTETPPRFYSKPPADNLLEAPHM